MRRFGDFISEVQLNAEQEEFLNSVISYVCENGDINREIVANEEPFTEHLGLFNQYMLPLANYIDTFHLVITPNEGMSA